MVENIVDSEDTSELEGPLGKVIGELSIDFLTRNA